MKTITVGITGTKGKTTVAHLIRGILNEAGIRTGLVSTIEVDTGLRCIPAVNTTPPHDKLMEYVKEMDEAGCQIRIIEVSSIGLKEQRVTDLWFDYGMFTNMGVDHIGPGEHDSFEEYFYWKKQLFKQCDVGIFHMEDPYYPAIAQEATCRIMGYCKDEENLSSLTVLPGDFNRENARGAITLCRELGVSDAIIRKALPKIYVKGRMEHLQLPDGRLVILDYAHNGMALEQALKMLKARTKGKVICLFGCGGNRSVLRRSGMGETAGTYADETIITSDNPRWEEPLEIIDDIVAGMKKTNGSYTVIPDRREAIAEGIRRLTLDDVLLLAGKGHETYQLIRGVRYEMDERKIVEEIVNSAMKSE
ncbi:UDP-N-acetylmuramoyl-L-alanyl-D-glutamate--2,6-diaminopimelate ligase [Anaerolentibacter hominis]|uniref:Mur ligase family protein n=1 Tax=Anaerolentibacter hominis TaxID=3079009 RepID=UPI0031B897D6